MGLTNGELAVFSDVFTASADAAPGLSPGVEPTLPFRTRGPETSVHKL